MITTKEINAVANRYQLRDTQVEKDYVLSWILFAISGNSERPGQPVKYTMRHETELVALACSKNPLGAKRWTVRSLAEELKKKEDFETINRETVRLILKKTNVTLGQK